MAARAAGAVSRTSLRPSAPRPRARGAGLALADRDRRRLDRRPDRARAADGRAVDHDRRDRLLGAREVVRGARRSSSSATCRATGTASSTRSLIAPGLAALRAVPDAYAAAKAINAVLMSLAAVPAYFLARRLLAPPLALVVAALTVLVPSMLYTGTLMTENAFYPLFLVVALALVATLERADAAAPGRAARALRRSRTRPARRRSRSSPPPRPRRSCSAAIERRGLRRGLRPYATLYGILAGGAVARAARDRRARPLAARAARRLPRRDDERLHGRAASCTSCSTTSPSSTSTSACVPFAALLALWLAPRAATLRRARVRGRVARALRSGSSLEVAVVRLAALGRQDRGAEHVLRRAARADRARRARRRRRRHAPPPAARSPPRWSRACCRSSSRSAASSRRARSPTPSRCCRGGGCRTTGSPRPGPLGRARGRRSRRRPPSCSLPRRSRSCCPALVAAYFVAHRVRRRERPARDPQGLASASSGPASTSPHPDWIDRAVGRDASVAVLWTGPARPGGDLGERVLQPQRRHRLRPRGRRPTRCRRRRSTRRADGVPRRGRARRPRAVRPRRRLASTSPGARSPQRPAIGLRLYRVGRPGRAPDPRRRASTRTTRGRAARVTYERVAVPRRPPVGAARQRPVALHGRPGRRRAREQGRGRRPRADRPRPAQATLTRPASPGAAAAARSASTSRAPPSRRARPRQPRRRALGAHFLSFDYRP